MKQRYYRILTILYQRYPNQWIKGTILAKDLEISSRTLRTDIGEMNTIVPGVIQSHTHRGYYLDREKYYVFQKQIPQEYMNVIPEKPEERIGWLLRQLLLNPSGICTSQLEAQLFISSYTLDLDILQLRKMINGYKGLSLKKKKDTLLLEGLEYPKRKLYRDLLTSEIQGEFINLNRLATLYPNFNMLEISKLFDATLKRLNYQVRSSIIPVLLVHIGISIDRMMVGQIVPYDTKDKTIEDSQEWQVAQQFLEEISQLLSISIPTCEVKMMARLLIGYREQAVYQTSSQQRQLEGFVEEILSEVKETIGIDFGEDTEFAHGLCIHLQGVLERLENQIHIPNLLLKNIKTQYPLVFDMAVYMANRLSQMIGMDLSEEEVGFIALHLGAGYARAYHAKKQRAILVGTINPHMKHLVVEKITDRFKDRIEIVGTLPYFEESVVLEKNVDLIVSCVALKHRLPVETIIITPFFNAQDELGLFKLLNELEKRQTNIEFNMMIGKFIDETFFYPQLEVETATEAITVMVDRLKQYSIVDDSFLESCLQREACSATSFDYSLAIPHPLVLNSRQSVISIAHLAHPIEWGGTRVEMVMLLALNEADREFMTIFFDWLARIISDRDSIQTLVSIDNRDQFIQYIVQH
ncbi:BglG family transcription antiterminator [Streptococcus respiraculi]|uniref:BglG family transcription antiterminator n=1 Tax=Streptococcus respiraculi TaxID=2021971 RepID=UPI000E7427BF|nr:PRD domain-containing protein [Streptococcus respiraculi]